MIRSIQKDELDKVYAYIGKDYGRNYFIALALVKGHVFKDIYMEEVDHEIKAILFHRKSNNLQFCAYGAFDHKGFIELIKSLDFDYLISPKSFCILLEPALVLDKKGAIISKLMKEDFVHTTGDTSELLLEDLDQVVSLYKTVFTGYPNKEFMKKKLVSKRGRGVCIRVDDKIVSLAQSEFENKDSALIVGVATDQAYQHKGYGSRCVSALADQLLKETHSVYLQYDNPEAGKIYVKIGFKAVDQVYHYKRG